MWGHCHLPSTSTDLCSDWVKFVQEAAERTHITSIYQHVTHEVLVFIKANMETGDYITREEETALRYVAGYICRKLRSHPHSQTRMTPAWYVW